MKLRFLFLSVLMMFACFATPTLIAADAPKPKVGGWIMDKRGFVFEVKNIYEDGRVEAFYSEGYSKEPMLPGSFSVEVPELNGAKPGVFVMDRAGYVYKIVRVYHDGRLETYYSEGYAHHPLKAGTYSLEVAARGSVKMGARVMDKKGYVYEVQRVFADGRIEALYSKEYGVSVLRSGEYTVEKKD